MFREQLINEIRSKKAFLCVGLDVDLDKVPDKFLNEDDPIFAFNKEIIDATKDFAVAYKPNLAFYEVYGAKGWEALHKTVNYIPENIFTIADAKRGDIGNTSGRYAKAILENMSFDCITVAPYMGADSVLPFLSHDKGKWVALLAATSNQGFADLQDLQLAGGQRLFQKVVSKSMEWGTSENLMFVTGATRSDIIAEIRQLAPENFFLVPGIGAQGGSLSDVCQAAMTAECGLLVNASRSVIYASRGEDFAEAARAEAQRLQQEMEQQLQAYQVI